MAAPASNGPDDTIFALSSGRLPAGIAVMRISGPAAGPAIEALAGRRPSPREATLRTLRDGEGALLDRALLLWFPGPASVTGEDVAELHLHGSIAIVAAVSRRLEALGLLLAEPGEFTRRALLAGRMALDEVEGLADLLAAETETQRREAMLRTSGALAARFAGWAQRLNALSARIEAAIDYDESDEVSAADILSREIAALRDEIRLALARPPAERLRDGIRVAIVGPVNAGKSSLFNALVGSEAAIVSAQPGTTRDVIERAVSIGDIPFVFSDTAGRRDADDAVERIGIERAAHADRDADLVLDLSGDAVSDDRRIAIAAKADLTAPRAGALAVSSVTGAGLDEAIKVLIDRARALLPAADEASLTRRHRIVLAGIVEALTEAADYDDIVLVAAALGEARRGLMRLGEGAGVEDMLDELFGRFCLGK